MRHAFPEGDSFSSVVVVSLLSKSTAEIIVIIMCFFSSILSIDSTKKMRQKYILCCVCIICYPLSSHQQQFSLSYDFLHIHRCDAMRTYEQNSNNNKNIFRGNSLAFFFFFHIYIIFRLYSLRCCEHAAVKKHVTKIKFSYITLSYLCSTPVRTRQILSKSPLIIS